MFSAIINAIGSVAPTIAQAIGGPLAGMATKRLSEALGFKTTPNKQELEKAIENASPEQWLAIKQCENDFTLELEKLGLDRDKLEQLDRDSARNREVAMAKAGKRDTTVPLLAILVTVGFFSLLGSMFFFSVPEEMRPIANIMTGSLGTSWTMIIAYYFGSSLGSRKKDEKNK